MIERWVSVPRPRRGPALPAWLNWRGHWANQKRLKDSQRVATRVDVGLLSPLRKGEAVVVTLTRVGRKMDSDNLASAFKAPRDEIAELLGVDDGDDRVSWVYTHQTAKQANRPASDAGHVFRVRIEKRAI